MSRRSMNRIIKDFDCGVSGSVPAAVVIYPGDIIWQHSDGWRPGNDTNLWNTDENTTAGDLKDKFVGIAKTGKSQTDHAENILVSRDCIARMPCASATYAYGSGICGARDGANDYFYAQDVKASGAVAREIARVTKAEASAVTLVEAHFRSSYTPDYIS